MKLEVVQVCGLSLVQFFWQCITFAQGILCRHNETGSRARFGPFILLCVCNSCTDYCIWLIIETAYGSFLRFDTIRLVSVFILEWFVSSPVSIFSAWSPRKSGHLGHLGQFCLLSKINFIQRILGGIFSLVCLICTETLQFTCRFRLHVICWKRYLYRGEPLRVESI